MSERENFYNFFPHLKIDKTLLSWLKVSRAYPFVISTVTAFFSKKRREALLQRKPSHIFFEPPMNLV